MAPKYLIEPIGVTHVTYGTILPHSRFDVDRSLEWPEAIPRKEVES
jgi:hypothetical protein